MNLNTNLNMHMNMAQPNWFDLVNQRHFLPMKEMNFKTNNELTNLDHTQDLLKLFRNIIDNLPISKVFLFNIHL